MRKQLPDKIPIRLAILVVGLFILSIGVAISAKSDLGVSPSSTIPYVISRAVPESVAGLFSMGNLTIVLHFVYLIVQIAILRKNFKIIQICQLGMVIIFGKFTDLSLYLFRNVTVTNYGVKLAMSVISCVIMGIGLFLEVKANLFTMPAEGAISVISNKLKMEFGKFKIGWDFAEILIGVALSLIFFRTFVGVREGTIIAAFLVGIVVSFCNRKFTFVNRLLNGEKEVTLESVAASASYPLVITIEREFGTGGHEIGEKLAKKLGIPFYDQAIIAKTADAAGVGIEEVTKTEEKLPLGLIYNLYNSTSYAATHNISMQDTIFKAQGEVIKDLAAKGSCVIVGRIGGFRLKNRPNTFNVFVTADSQFRAERLAEKFDISVKKAHDLVKREDHARANYCQHFTGEPWGLACHYNLALDSSMYDIDSSVELIMQSLNIKDANDERLKALYERKFNSAEAAEN